MHYVSSALCVKPIFGSILGPFHLQSDLQMLHAFLTDKQYFVEGRRVLDSLRFLCENCEQLGHCGWKLLCAPGYSKSSARLSRMMTRIQNLILHIHMLLKSMQGL